MTVRKPDISKSALLVIDMQNDFVHSDGALGRAAAEMPNGEIDLPFLMGTIPHVKRLVCAFRDAGRPVVYIVHTVRPDYSDAQFPYWRFWGRPDGNNRFIIDDTWGARIVDDLSRRERDHVIIKKGFNGFSNTPLDTVLRNMGVTTCVVTGVTTCVCVSSTVRGGVEHNYHMIVVTDAVAEVSRETHEAELKTTARIFADYVTTSDGVITMLSRAHTRWHLRRRLPYRMGSAEFAGVAQECLTQLRQFANSASYASDSKLRKSML